MAKKKKSAKRRAKGKKPTAATAQQDPAISDLLKRLTKAHKKGSIRGILTIALGPEINSSSLQWAGQTAPAEMMGPISIVKQIYVNSMIDQVKQAK